MMSSRAENRLRLASIDDLFGVLGTPRSRLLHIAAHAPELYGFFLSGPKRREIRPSREPLKTLQERLADHIESVNPYSSHAMGGVRSRSVIDHARPHVGRKMVATLDIRKCFPSTTPDMVNSALIRCGTPADVAALIVDLTTVDNQLPQGAPTSTAITNIVLLELDKAYEHLGALHGLRYTRYVDDIALSADYDFTRLRPVLEAPILALGYAISPEKVRFMIDGRRQVVTGLIVNDKMRPTKEWVRELKRLIRRTWDEDHEVLSAEEDCRSPYHLYLRVRGKINHLKRVDPKLGKEVERLIYRTRWAWQKGQGASVEALSSTSPTAGSSTFQNSSTLGAHQVPTEG